VAAELRHVSKWFGDHQVLRDISLQVHRGEVLVLLGASGSGKSTLCRTINGLETVQEGEVLVDGVPLPTSPAELAAVRARIGMVFQGFHLFPEMTAAQNITLGPVRVRGMNPEKALQEAEALLDRVGLAGLADRLPEELSGGQQQRVAIARALAMRPQMVLFDEPTSALDPDMVGEVLEVMNDLALDGLTMVVVTHEIGFAKQAADRVVFLSEGAIMEQGRPEEFFAHPTTPEAARFLSRVLS